MWYNAWVKVLSFFKGVFVVFTASVVGAVAGGALYVLAVDGGAFRALPAVVAESRLVDSVSRALGSAFGSDFSVTNTAAVGFSETPNISTNALRTLATADSPQNAATGEGT